MRFEYPIKITSDTEEGIEDKVVKLMGSQNTLGFYPIGRLNNWHGGIHLEGKDEVLAIADGRIIAYRLPKTYLIETIAGINYEYSNGFVLIQHDYKSPNGLELTFYSLYHHLCSYEQLIKDDKPLADFIVKNAFMVKGTATVEEVKGDHYKSSPSATTNLGFLAKGTEITKVGNPSGDYQKITSAAITSSSAFIKKTHIKATVASTNLDIVKNCDKPVKAGTLIGHTGMYGFEKQANYHASHLDVFTADSVTDFLNGKSEDIADSKNYFKISENKELRKVTPYSMKNGWNIKVLTPGINYSRIEQSAIEGTVLYSDLVDNNKKNKEGLYYYTSKTGEAFGRNNSEFKSLLKAGSVLVKVTAFEETVNGIKIKKRNVKLEPTDNRKYWVANSKLPSGTSELQFDLTELFLEDPGTVLIDKVEVDVILRKNALKMVKDEHGIFWYFVKCSYLKDGARKTKSGWIKEQDVSPVSAYNWKEFGFSALEDLNDKFVYEFEETPAFLKKILKEIDTITQEQDAFDTDRPDILTAFELRNALSKTHIAKGLSHLVCKHTSEWACDKATVKSEVSTFLEKGISKEENHLRKEEFKKRKQQILDSIDLRLPKLNIWDEIQNGSLSSITSVTATASATNTTPLRKFPTEKKVYHFHPIAFVEHMKRITECNCGRYLGLTFLCVVSEYGIGPKHSGSESLASYKDWDKVIENGVITEDEKLIIIAMSENEGNMDAVQSYDDQVVSVGAMQKTVNITGSGELPIQIWEFKNDYPEKYETLFRGCGWTVEIASDKKKLYYQDPSLNSPKVTGTDLKNLIRTGFDSSTKNKRLVCTPLNAFVFACKDLDFQAKQLEDFIKRLIEAIDKQPVKTYSGSKSISNISAYHTHKISDYVKSNLGKAVVLDHSINRPAWPIFDFGSALNTFYTANPTVSKDPTTWGNNHNTYETEILETYGPSRDMTDASDRYTALKNKL
ncbi:MAG: hypothetical protein H7329_17885 [Opitutaceae bacterium]|nr:hypothetical protein [Cytophagales bacterium]